MNPDTTRVQLNTNKHTSRRKYVCLPETAKMYNLKMTLKMTAYANGYHTNSLPISLENVQLKRGKAVVFCYGIYFCGIEFILNCSAPN